MSNCLALDDLEGCLGEILKFPLCDWFDDHCDDMANGAGQERKNIIKFHPRILPMLGKKNQMKRETNKEIHCKFQIDAIISEGMLECFEFQLFFCCNFRFDLIFSYTFFFYISFHYACSGVPHSLIACSKSPQSPVCQPTRSTTITFPYEQK